MTDRVSLAAALVLRSTDAPSRVSQAAVLVLSRELLTAPSKVTQLSLQVLGRPVGPRVYTHFDSNYRAV